jgi:hypothetical protein
LLRCWLQTRYGKTCASKQDDVRGEREWTGSRCESDVDGEDG